ncbi:uncharacterized protein LOC141915353 [Tubulanus polymorphus]|uniref:uncharacterized protein LOC141915353 n=1 Tax=Tubulanus polymorphus TaxID=672921 RepID=UPI003DA20DDC
MALAKPLNMNVVYSARNTPGKITGNNRSEYPLLAVTRNRFVRIEPDLSSETESPMKIVKSFGPLAKARINGVKVSAQCRKPFTPRTGETIKIYRKCKLNKVQQLCSRPHTQQPANRAKSKSVPQTPPQCQHDKLSLHTVDRDFWTYWKSLKHMDPSQMTNHALVWGTLPPRHDRSGGATPDDPDRISIKKIFKFLNITETKVKREKDNSSERVKSMEGSVKKSANSLTTVELALKTARRHRKTSNICVDSGKTNSAENVYDFSTMKDNLWYRTRARPLPLEQAVKHHSVTFGGKLKRRSIANSPDDRKLSFKNFPDDHHPERQQDEREILPNVLQFRPFTVNPQTDADDVKQDYELVRKQIRSQPHYGSRKQYNHYGHNGSSKPNGHKLPTLGTRVNLNDIGEFGSSLNARKCEQNVTGMSEKQLNLKSNGRLLTDCCIESVQSANIPEYNHHSIGNLGRSQSDTTRTNKKPKKVSIHIPSLCISGKVNTSTDQSGYRLPQNLIPVHYKLELWPDFYGDHPYFFKSKGIVTIDIKCINKTNEIVLNAKALTVQPESLTRLNDRLSMWIRSDYIAYSQESFDITRKLFNGMEDFIGVPYTLNKLDFIAVNPFLFAGMENWGMTTLRETKVAYDIDLDPQTSYPVVTLGHEIAHQWFGNLVTMNWWGDVWLKESFCHYLVISLKTRFIAHSTDIHDIAETFKFQTITDDDFINTFEKVRI